MRNPKKMILLEPIGPYKSEGAGHFYPCQNSTILNLTFVRKVTFIIPMMISAANKKNRPCCCYHVRFATDWRVIIFSNRHNLFELRTKQLVSD